MCVFGSLWVLIKRLGLPVLQCNDTFCVLSLSIFSPCSLIVGSAFTSFLLQFLCILVYKKNIYLFSFFFSGSKAESLSKEGNAQFVEKGKCLL